MPEHDWRRHGAFLACTQCGKIWRQPISLESCHKTKKATPKPDPRPQGQYRSLPQNRPSCTICQLPLLENDLASYLESGGDINTHLTCTISRPI